MASKRLKAEENWTGRRVDFPAFSDALSKRRAELGEPEHPDYFSRRFKNLVTAADVPLIRLHDLRHTNATLSLKAGVHPKVVSERLGHASIAITLDLYSHVTPGISREAADAVESMVYD